MRPLALEPSRRRLAPPKSKFLSIKRLKMHDPEATNVSVKHYSNENLNVAQHPTALEKLENTVLAIAHREGPLGNDSCGPGPLLKYRIPVERMNFTVVIELLDSRVSRRR